MQLSMVRESQLTARESSAILVALPKLLKSSKCDSSKMIFSLYRT
jgi:hypothetical protein